MGWIIIMLMFVNILIYAKVREYKTERFWNVMFVLIFIWLGVSIYTLLTM